MVEGLQLSPVSRLRHAVPGLVLTLVFIAGACRDSAPPATRQDLPPLPPPVREKLSTHLDSTRTFATHVWRDTPPLNSDGTVNGYIEISRGESTKWEFRIPFNRRDVDRMIPESLGGYPTNYGFMPRTVSYDGDPADVLVLGPALAGGSLVRGHIIGLMRMTDTGDLDSKVVLCAPTESTCSIDSPIRQRLEQFFSTYKRHEGKETSVPGFGDREEALQFLKTTASFFETVAKAR